MRSVRSFSQPQPFRSFFQVVYNSNANIRFCRYNLETLDPDVSLHQTLLLQSAEA